MSRPKPCYLPCAPVNFSLSQPLSSSSSSSALCSHRVALSPSTNERLKRYVSRRMRGSGSASRLGGIVLDTYLGHMERFYFGRAGVRACVPLSRESRDRDAVIFDMDGVLCDSEVVSRRVGALVFSKLYNVDDVKPDDFLKFTGTGEGNFLQGVANLYGVSGFNVEEAKQKFFELYVNSGYSLNVKSFVGIPGLIDRIKQCGLKVGIASAADRIKVDANLRAIGLDRDGLFDYITSSEKITRKKPAPDVFLQAASGLNVEPQRCTVIEDAVAGVQAAKSAGMRCVAVTTSMEEKELRDAGADVVRKEPATIELRDIFETDVFAQI